MDRQVVWRVRLCRAARTVAQPGLLLIVFGNETPRGPSRFDRGT
jgi:hypothetical protein